MTARRPTPGGLLQQASDCVKALPERGYICGVIFTFSLVLEKLAHALFGVVKVEKAALFDDRAEHDKVLALYIVCFGCELNNIDGSDLNAFWEGVVGAHGV